MYILMNAEIDLPKPRQNVATLIIAVESPRLGVKRKGFKV
jgi:hypothetical protein